MTQNAELDSLIKTIAEQANTEIPIADESPATAIRQVFNDGETIKAIAKHHERYSAKHGRIYPLYDDDEGFDDAQPSEALTDDAVEAVYYAWTQVEAATTFSTLSAAYENLMNACSDLASWVE